MQKKAKMPKKTKATKKVDILHHEHDRYVIKAGVLQDKFVARAFPKPPSKFRHLVAEASGKSTEDAIERLIEKLETLRQEHRALRRVDQAMATGVPTTEEYADALRTLSPGPKLMGTLHDHALARRRGINLGELSKAGGFSSAKDLINAYEKLGMEIFKVVEPDETLDKGLSAVMNVTGEDAVPSTTVGTLQPELQDALLHLLGVERRAV